MVQVQYNLIFLINIYPRENPCKLTQDVQVIITTVIISRTMNLHDSLLQKFS